jgi:hypothetical protein
MQQIMRAFLAARCLLLAGESSVLLAVQMFSGPQLQGWCEPARGWPPPAPAHVAMCAHTPHSCVLVIPKAAILEAARIVEESCVRRVMDQLCTVSALRHLSMTQLAHLARYSKVQLQVMPSLQHCHIVATARACATM